MLLQREKTSDQGTFGTLFVSSILTLKTAELPQEGNTPGLSCIPAGTYPACWTTSEKFPEGTYLVCNVPGRSGIRIHCGNFAGDVTKGFQSDVLGCILIGTELGILTNEAGNPQQVVLHSRDAFAQMNALLNQQPFTLIVKDNV